MEECRHQIEADKAAKKAKKEEKRRVQLLLKQQAKMEKKPKHVSAVDTSVRTVMVDDIWQTIKDCNCTYVTGEDEEDSNVDNVFSPRDVEKTFKMF